ncbi:TPA: hypothetical protein N0F65_002977 [Lagenidium giganteum]|uniref:Intron-binding protein aquarius n=1 Tax=Lagenidium giganteum TaxID=4803 RepID=A0AAV2YP28_9STRA|nr:TPA: hypothetical protein N0F65_002977 [Lagenidium giganteum]
MSDNDAVRATAAAIAKHVRASKHPAALDLVSKLYDSHLTGSDAADVLAAVRELEDARCLEDSLWPLAPHVTTQSKHAKEWLLVALMLINDALQQSGDVWALLCSDEDAFGAFATLLLDLKHSHPDASAVTWTPVENAQLVRFLAHCFQSLDQPVVARQVLKLASLPLWSALSASQRQLEFEQHPPLQRHWRHVMESSTAKTNGKDKTPTKRRKVQAPAASRHEQAFLIHLVTEFFAVIEADADGMDADTSSDQLTYVAVFLAWIIDMLSQLPTRRFLHTVLRRLRFAARLHRSAFVRYCLEWRSSHEIQALKSQLQLVDVMLQFPIDVHTGKALSAREFKEAMTSRIQHFQQLVFKEHRDTRMEGLSLLPVSSFANPKTLREQLVPLVASDRPLLEQVLVQVGIVGSQDEAHELTSDELVDALVVEFADATTEGNAALLSGQHKPLALTELDIWSTVLEDHKDSVYGSNRLLPVLPVRKLGLQFLTMGDYLHRCHELYRLEAIHSVREDLERVIRQVDPIQSLAGDGRTSFRGFAQLAAPLETAFEIVKVSKPALGEVAPATVLGQFDVELSSEHEFQQFDAIQPKELVFLLTIRATNDEAAEAMGYGRGGSNEDAAAGYFPEEHGVVYVRTAEVVEVVDEKGNSINEEHPIGRGRKRTFKVALDGQQYKKDLENNNLDAYETVNILIRRHPQVNNLKSTLDTLATVSRGANSEEALPSWLHDLFLGYGDPAAATYASIAKANQLESTATTLRGVFVDAAHAVEACASDKGASLLVDENGKKLAAADAVAPFTLVEEFDTGEVVVKARRHKKGDVVAEKIGATDVRMTKAQVKAIRAGLQEGLTTIVGPPGTGKTEVAARLVANLCVNASPKEKILVVSNSDQALANLFEKISAIDVVNPRHIVQLGQPIVGGSKWSSGGRVDYLLQRRLDLLAKVEELAKALETSDGVKYAGLCGSVSYSCENALVFYEFHVKPIFDAGSDTSAQQIRAVFGSMLVQKTGDVQSFIKETQDVFDELRSLQPFELLRSAKQRGDMYLLHHARVIALTCTDVALNHRKLVDLRLQFSSLVLEEAAQVSEVDSVLPLLLACQSTSTTTSNDKSHPLKRLVLIGDANQLPPAVNCSPLKKDAHLGQSVFSRFLRLGVPQIVLDQQGSSRPQLADVYRWCYSFEGVNQLADFLHVADSKDFTSANAGFAHVGQIVQVPNAKERQVQPTEYDNEEEARLLVKVVGYMAAVGYPLEKITILTSYSAQQVLIQKMLQEQNHAVVVSTIDDYQSNHNDFVLLSTVRSGSTLGPLRDVRRASVAFSRARFGLYVFGTTATLNACKELEPFVERLDKLAPKSKHALELVVAERFGQTSRKVTVKLKAAQVTRIDNGAAQVQEILTKL